MKKTKVHIKNFFSLGFTGLMGINLLMISKLFLDYLVSIDASIISFILLLIASTILGYLARLLSHYVGNAIKESKNTINKDWLD